MRCTPIGVTGEDMAIMQAPAAVAGKRERLAHICHRSGVLKILRRVRDLRTRDVRILAYHRVLDIADEDRFDFDLALVSASLDQFREQMLHLRRYYRPIRMDDWLDAVRAGRRLPRRCVIVTFDDGYDDNYRHAFPILRDLDMSALFFVSTGHIDDGTAYAYDWLVHMILTTTETRFVADEIGIDQLLPSTRQARRELAALVLGRIKWLSAAMQSALITRLATVWRMPRDGAHADCRPMSWQQLREMRDGGMEIGSHGVSHRMLAKLPPDEIHEEVATSRRRLDDELGPVATSMSYPVGNLDAWNDTVIEEARAAGFQAGCSYVSGTNRVVPRSWWELRRLAVEREMNAAWFASMMAVPEAFSYPSRLRMG